MPIMGHRGHGSLAASGMTLLALLLKKEILVESALSTLAISIESLLRLSISLATFLSMSIHFCVLHPVESGAGWQR